MTTLQKMEREQKIARERFSAAINHALDRSIKGDASLLAFVTGYLGLDEKTAMRLEDARTDSQWRY